MATHLVPLQRKEYVHISIATPSESGKTVTNIATSATTLIEYSRTFTDSHAQVYAPFADVTVNYQYWIHHHCTVMS